MKNYSLFIIGIIMLVFAGMFHIYRHGVSIAKAPPPKPTTPPTTAKPIPSAPKPVPPPLSKPSTTEPLTTPPVQKAGAAGAQVATKTSRTTTATTPPPPTGASASSSSKIGDATNVLEERSSSTEVRKK